MAAGKAAHHLIYMNAAGGFYTLAKIVASAHPCIGASIRSLPCGGVGLHLIYDADTDSGRPACYLCNDCAFAERHGYYPIDVPSYLPEPEGHTLHCREVCTGDDPDECHCNSSTTGRP